MKSSFKSKDSKEYLNHFYHPKLVGCIFVHKDRIFYFFFKERKNIWSWSCLWFNRNWDIKTATPLPSTHIHNTMRYQYHPSRTPEWSMPLQFTMVWIHNWRLFFHPTVFVHQGQIHCICKYIYCEDFVLKQYYCSSCRTHYIQVGHIKNKFLELGQF